MTEVGESLRCSRCFDRCWGDKHVFVVACVVVVVVAFSCRKKLLFCFVLSYLFSKTPSGERSRPGREGRGGGGGGGGGGLAHSSVWDGRMASDESTPTCPLCPYPNREGQHVAIVFSSQHTVCLYPRLNATVDTSAKRVGRSLTLAMDWGPASRSTRLAAARWWLCTRSNASRGVVRRGCSAQGSLIALGRPRRLCAATTTTYLSTVP